MHDLVLGALPPQSSQRDLGEHRLKDLSRLEYVYQLVAPELASEFPAKTKAPKPLIMKCSRLALFSVLLTLCAPISFICC